MENSSGSKNPIGPETPGMSRTLKPCCGGPPYCCMRTAWLRAGVSAGAMPWKLAVTGERSERAIGRCCERDLDQVKGRNADW